MFEIHEWTTTARYTQKSEIIDCVTGERRVAGRFFLNILEKENLCENGYNATTGIISILIIRNISKYEVNFKKFHSKIEIVCYNAST